MDGNFITPLMVALYGTPIGAFLALVAVLGVRDRKARTDPLALLLSSLALLINAGICVAIGPGIWCFWVPLAAGAWSLLAVWLCLRARFA
jgi:hypothetical protein